MRKITVIGLVGNSVFLNVDKFHVGGETVEAHGIHRELGGKGFNQAVAAARFGADVCFVSAVGKDECKTECEAFLKDEGIKPILFAKEEGSAFAAIITDASGANRVTEYIGAKLDIQDVEAIRDEIASSDILMLSNEVPQEVNELAADIAYKNGVKIILNPAPYRKANKDYLDKIFLFTPNEYEAKDLDDYKNVIQTLGAKGCLIKETGKIVPGLNLKPVDTTGAGDTFNGALAASLVLDGDILKAVEVAIKASGISVTKKGAVSSIPRKNEI